MLYIIPNSNSSQNLECRQEQSLREHEVKATKVGTSSPVGLLPLDVAVTLVHRCILGLYGQHTQRDPRVPKLKIGHFSPSNIMVLLFTRILAQAKGV